MTFSEMASDSMYYFNLRYFHAWGYRPAMTIAVDLGRKANKQIHAWDIFISGNNHYITVIVVHYYILPDPEPFCVSEATGPVPKPENVSRSLVPDPKTLSLGVWYRIRRLWA